MVIKVKDKSAQMTIFIILAIVVVVGIVAIFFFMNRMSTEGPSYENPKEFIEDCVQEIVTESAEKVLLGGGMMEPEFFQMYKGNKYHYLCYQQKWYLPCINQFPQLKEKMEKEIEENRFEVIKQCFEDLKEDYEDRNYDVSEDDLSFSVELMSHKVKINLDKNLQISKDETRQSFDNFDTSVQSSVFDLAMVAREIVNQESQYCNFEYNGFMILYPDYTIKRIDYEDDKLYRVIFRKSGEEFKFAVRSCAFAHGI